MRGLRARKAVLATVGAAAISLGLGAEAGAHAYNASSTVTIGGRFFGYVYSGRPACEGGRTVRLFRVRRGADRLIATDTTSSGGRWAIGRPNARGRFYVRVSRRVRSAYGHSHSCQGDVSRVVRRR